MFSKYFLLGHQLSSNSVQAQSAVFRDGLTLANSVCLLMQFDRAEESIAAGEQAVEHAAASLGEVLPRLNWEAGTPLGRMPLPQPVVPH